MPTNFMDLSGELRNRIYELVLVTDVPVLLLPRYRQEEVDLGLLQANKTIHREASSILYGQNQFDLTCDILDDDERSIFADLRRIRDNAALIRSILVDFPDVKFPDEPSMMIIRKRSTRFLNQLRNLCPNVRKITIPVASTGPLEDRLCMGDAPINYSQVICMINTHFGMFESLSQITVMARHHVPDGEDFFGKCNELREDMVHRGWKIQIIGQVAVEEDEHSNIECEGYDHDSDGYERRLYGSDSDSHDPYARYEIDSWSDY